MTLSSKKFNLREEAMKISGYDFTLVNKIVALCNRCSNEALKKAAGIADARRDKEYNAGKFKAQIGKHDWVVQFHNGAALAASEISQQIDDLKSAPASKDCKHQFSECGQCNFCGQLNVEKP